VVQVASKMSCAELLSLSGQKVRRSQMQTHQTPRSVGAKFRRSHRELKGGRTQKTPPLQPPVHHLATDIYTTQIILVADYHQDSGDLI